MLLTEKIRSKLSKKLLDFAEALSDVDINSRTLKNLQEIRKSQRKDSDNSFNHSRLPSNLVIESRNLVLTEVFEAENINSLIKGLKKLFPNIRTTQEFITNIGESIDSLNSLSSTTIGIVYRSGNSNNISMYKMIPDSALPAFIQRVEVYLHRAIASLFILEFVFIIEESSTKELLDLQAKKYLPDSEFIKIPFGLNARYVSEKAIEASHQRAVLDYLLKEKTECLKWIAKYFKNHAYLKSSKKIAFNHSMEIIKIKNIGNPLVLNDEDFDKWKITMNGWAETLGIDLHNRYNFSYKNFLFCWSSRGREKQSIPAKLIIFESEDNNIDYHIDVIHGLTIPLALSKYLDFLQENIQQIRHDAYKINTQVSKRLNRDNMKNSFKLEQIIRLLERLSLDITNHQGWLVHEMQSIHDFRSRFDNKINLIQGLDSKLFENIHNHIKFIQGHALLVKNSLTNLVNLQNIASMYNLQRWIFWLTSIVTTVTVIQYGSELKSFCLSLISFFSKYFSG